MKSHMGQYYMHAGPSAFRFELTGDLNNEGARRLEQDWRTASSVISDRALIGDLTFVTSAEEEGRTLFARWYAAGVELIAKVQCASLVSDSEKKAKLQMRSRQLLAILSVLAVTSSAVLYGDDKAEITPRSKTAEAAVVLPRANIRIDTNVVLIPVTVTDPLNRFVTGLDQNTFKVFEDKQEQKLVSFGSEDAPLSIGIVFDTSGSMGLKLDKSRQAVSEFFKTANPEDEAFLVVFNDRPELVTPLTHNLEEIQNRLTFTQSKGQTALLDGILLGLHTMKKAHNPRKALVVISDGGDNSSRYTESEIKSLVKESDVQIYAIGIYESIESRGRTLEELAGPGLLTDVSEPTGGRHFVVENLNELPDVAAKIGIELRNQYVLGYSPTNEVRDGKYRKVGVKLIPPMGLPPLHAFWRTGYYAPTQ
jgi:Ca-activated chloride channel family protein